MQSTYQHTRDSRVDENFGYCDGRLIALDTEEWFFGSASDKITEYKNNLYESYRSKGCTPNIAIRQVMVDLYQDYDGFMHLITAYDYHQPLRQQIDTALNEPDLELRHGMLRDFYQRCRDCVVGKDLDVELFSPWTGKPEDNIPKSIPIPHPA